MLNDITSRMFLDLRNQRFLTDRKNIQNILERRKKEDN